MKNNRVKKIIAVMAVTIAIASGTFLVSSVVNNNLFQHIALATSENNAHKASWSSGERGWHRSGGGRAGKWHRKLANMEDEDIQNIITRFVKHAAIEIDATEQQQQKIIESIMSLAKELKTMDVHKDMHQAREEFQKLLLEDDVNGQEIENLRAEKIKQMDEVSKKITMTVVDVAQTLEPEQRKIISEKISRFRSWGRGHEGRHGRHGKNRERKWWWE